MKLGSQMVKKNTLKIYFLKIFGKFLPHNGNFFWKVFSKIIYTFYLKYQKYHFCAPIFNPISDTESNKNIESKHVHWI